MTTEVSKKAKTLGTKEQNIILSHLEEVKQKLYMLLCPSYCKLDNEPLTKVEEAIENISEAQRVLNECAHLDTLDMIYWKQAVKSGDTFIQSAIEKGHVCRNCVDDDECVDICKALYNTCALFESKK